MNPGGRRDQRRGLLLDRATRPRGWVLTEPVDPNLPIRGRYFDLVLVVPAPAGAATSGSRSLKAHPRVACPPGAPRNHPAALRASSCGGEVGAITPLEVPSGSD